MGDAQLVSDAIDADEALLGLCQQIASLISAAEIRGFEVCAVLLGESDLEKLHIGGRLFKVMGLPVMVSAFHDGKPQVAVRLK